MAPLARQSSQLHSYALIDPMMELLDKSEINIQLEKQEDPHWIESDSIEMNTIDTPAENEGKREIEQNMSKSKKLKMQENAFSTENYLAYEKEEYKVQTNLQNLLLKFRIIEKHAKMKLRSLLERDHVSSKQNITKLQLLCEYYENVVCKFDLFVAKYSLYQHLEQDEDFQDILNCVTEIIRMYDSVPSLVTFLKTKIEQKKEYVWCSFLGLSDEVADYLTGLDKLHRQHQTNENWILNYFNERFETLPEGLSHEDGFKYLGFTDCRASFLADCLSQSSLSDHQTILYWASSYIQQYFDHHILFSGRPYLPRREEQDEPFLMKTVPSLDTADEDPVYVEGKNIRLDTDDIRKFKGNQWITDYLAQDCTSMEDTEYWFHGTKDVDAINIVENGIMLCKGKRFGHDFSRGDGFYITNDFHFAFEWARGFRKKWPNSAIVVFKIKDKTIFTNNDRKCKRFDDDSKEWKEVVSYFRNNENHIEAKISKSKASNLKKFESLYGPCSMDGDKVKNGDFWTPTARQKNYDPHRARDSKCPAHNFTYQLCLKDDLLADDFYNQGLNIHKVLFF